MNVSYWQEGDRNGDGDVDDDDDGDGDRNDDDIGDGDDGDDDIVDGDALNGSYWREVSPPENGRRGTHRFVAQQPNNTLSTEIQRNVVSKLSNTFNTLCTASRKSTELCIKPPAHSMNV